MAYTTRTLNPGVGGGEVAVDLISGADHQRMKLGVGGEGAAADFQQPLTDTQLRNTPVPVSGGLTDTQLRATPVPISGPLTDTQLRASAVAVTQAGGTPFYGTKAVTATESALASNACKEVTIKALNTNVIPVYLGITGVTTSTGFELLANQSIKLKVSNTNLIFVIASATGASICFIGTN